MTLTRSFFLIWLLSVLGVCIYFVDNVAASSDADASLNATFQRMQSLVGRWQARLPGGRTVSLTVESVSDGSALLFTEQEPGGRKTITMIRPDGDALLAAHYSVSGGVPRLVAQGTPDSAVVRFSPSDGANPTSARSERTTSLSFHFLNGNRYTEERTWLQQGQQHSQLLEFTRTQVMQAQASSH